MKSFSCILLSALSLAIVPTLPGCVAVAAAGIAGVVYVNGDLEATLAGSPQKIVQATEAALKDMDVPVVSRDSSGVDGKVVGRTALQKKIEVIVQRETDTTSKVSIRVDTFGDEALSRQVLDKIKSKL